MAHFAELSKNDIVLRVLSVAEKDTQDENGNEKEEIGVEFLKNIFGQNTKWKQTSYNQKFRKNYAGINYYYDSLLDAFIPPRPFNSWLLNIETAQWEPPVPVPQLTDKQRTEGYWYNWDEDNVSWVLEYTPRG